MTIPLGGCGNDLFSPPAPLFAVPLSIEGDPVGEAIVDTGGGYELMLADDFGLPLVGTAEVIVFGGRQRAHLTGSFRYAVGDIEAVADSALVGLSLCDCNGVGFRFLRKTGVVLSLDFENLTVRFDRTLPDGGVALPFETPPETLGGFDSAFVTVEVEAIPSGRSRPVLALLDTGTNYSVLRRGLLGEPAYRRRLEVTVSHDTLGRVRTRVTLFDTPGLPDMIVGTDLMRAWSDRWSFRFDPQGGTIVAFPTPTSPGTAPAFRRASGKTPTPLSSPLPAVRTEPSPLHSLRP